MVKALNIPKVFIGFLIASLLFWFLMNLSKEYTTEINFSIAYQNLEQDKLIQNSPQKDLNLLIKGNGFKLLGANFTRNPILLDLKKLQKKSDTEYYLLTKNHIAEIQKQLKSGLTLANIPQDSIFFTISKLSSKKVPIRPNTNIAFKKGFDIASPIDLKPDSIVISGAQQDLKGIDFISTEKIELTNLSENFSQQVNIELPEKVKVRQFSTMLSLNVDKFTEGETEVPIIVKNIPKGDNVNVFPKVVTITYKVGLKNFNKVTSSSFEVVCDYNESEKNNLPYLVPELKVKTNLVSSVRIVPNKIDFLIHK
ncbi:CdaR family protein [Tenacibaculum sp. TC6]|uniref:CdaR family protein n=1 Tax=Tenacibaculum sp. TC6 TaxID=3423223 RepID=UPI003D36DD2F